MAKSRSRTEALADLARAEVQERQRQREAELAAGEARQEGDRARSRLVDAHASGKSVAAAEKAHERALKGADDAMIRAEAAQRRLDRAGEQHRAFEAEHARELIEELRSAGDQAAGKITAGVAAAVQGHGEWHVIAQRVSELLRAVPGSSPQDSPSEHQLEGIRRDLKRAAGVEVSSPLPRYAALSERGEEQRRVRGLLAAREQQESAA